MSLRWKFTLVLLGVTLVSLAVTMRVATETALGVLLRDRQSRALAAPTFFAGRLTPAVVAGDRERLANEVAGFRLQQELGGREQIDKDFVKQLQEFSLTDQKQFTHRILSIYLEHDLTVPAIVQKLHGGFAYSQMFLLGLIGEKPKDKV